MLHSERKSRFILPIAISLIGFVVLIAIFVIMQRQNVSADADFQEEFRGVGYFSVVSGGTGTRGIPATGEWTGSGDIVLNLPDDAVIRKARLIWTGRSTNFDADGVLMAIDGVNVGRFNADLQFQQFPWCCSGAGQLHESVDVSAHIQPGTHTYTISDHEHGLSPVADNLNYGVGIWVVYEDLTPDPSDLESELIVYQGQDSFFRLWDPPRGPHTEARCVSFDPVDEVRKTELTHLVSGVDPWDTSTNAPRERSVAIWHATGNGPQPPPNEIAFGDTEKIPSLANHPNAEGVGPGAGVTDPVPYPLQSYAGLEWDNFTMELNVQPNDSWVCFQIESGDSQDLSNRGNAGLDASGMWNLFAINVLIPSSVTLADFKATAVSPDHVIVNWRTEFEDNHFAFELYRSNVNDFATAELIHFEPGSSENANGASYRFDDQNPHLGNNYYWLVDKDNSGEETRHGPEDAHVSLIDTIFLPLLRR